MNALFFLFLSLPFIFHLTLIDRNSFYVFVRLNKKSQYGSIISDVGTYLTVFGLSSNKTTIKDNTIKNLNELYFGTNRSELVFFCFCIWMSAFVVDITMLCDSIRTGSLECVLYFWFVSVLYPMIMFSTYGIVQFNKINNILNDKTQNHTIGEEMIINLTMFSVVVNAPFPLWLKRFLFKIVFRFVNVDKMYLMLSFSALCLNIRLNENQETALRKNLLASVLYSMFVLKQRNEEFENYIYGEKSNHDFVINYIIKSSFLKEQYICFLKKMCTDQEYAELLLKY